MRSRSYQFVSAFATIASVAFAGAEQEARQILQAKCWACHGQTATAGLRLDSRAGLLKGARRGPAIVPGKPAESPLFQALVAQPGSALKTMPPGGPLSAAEIATIETWIREGAPFSNADASRHWSFGPLRQAQPVDTIDLLVARSLTANQLQANPPADRRTLIRRTYFDLTGLPPSEAEFQAAFASKDPGWYAQLVETLLASPHYGEKWGRHWLDVARYGEDDYSGTEPKAYANAWRYRDWVIDAFNRDLPYDRFLKAQLAADLMDDPSLMGGLGFMGAGPWYYGISQPPQARADERHDRVDAVTRGMLGVTLACARCHDHKYDPLTAKDYYALAGVFASSRYKEYPLVPQSQADAWDARKRDLDQAEKDLKKFVDQESKRLGEKLAPLTAEYMLAASAAGAGTGLDAAIVDRWREYLKKPEEFHPFLKDWFATKSPEAAKAFGRLINEILAEKRLIDEDNRRAVEAADKVAAKPTRTIILPFGYRSDEDFNPGAFIPAKSLDRDRYVAYNRTLNEKGAPFKLDEALTARLLEPEKRAEYDRRKSQVETLKKELPPQYPFLMGLAEFDSFDLNLNLRGNPEQLGDIVPRRFPLVLSGGSEVPLRDGSGRKQLAEAVASHPLAARVAVNRIWMHLFGQGIVRTPSNLGFAGDPPSNPELLDHLAAKFVAGRFSVKAVIREILLSDAYQRSADLNPANDKIDAANRYFSRQNRRRLEAEPLRDAMLAAAGLLDRTVGGESKPLTDDFRRRTVYARVGRFQADETLSLFDLPAAAVTCEQRVVTNVPLQKLFFLNSGALDSLATALGRSLETSPTPEAGVETAYARLFHRAPTSRERTLALAFLAQPNSVTWKQYAQVLLSSNEFAYVD